MRAAGDSETLPACATIPVETVDVLDSGKAKIGDRFRFRAIDTVLTPQGPRVERGALGYGIVEFVVAAAAHGRPGQLLLEARYFSLPHGKQLEVTIDAAASNEVHSGATGNAPGIFGAVPLPFMGVAVGAFNYFHAGKNVTIPPGSRFAVTPVGDLAKPRRCRPELQL
ncbi:MAG: hypothetical protein JO043_12345 [Candidatus Eremiobacteraeota bacterium]|nr:hypothetical protein [Candidatus Eremiobacteraeota bacterium]